MSDARNQIIRTTATLLELQGYAATGISEIIRESGAPRGSLYYYFPDGKEELVAEAILESGKELVQHVRREMAAYPDPAEAVFDFISRVGEHVVNSECRSGTPIAAVALESAATSPRLAAACRTAYDDIRGAFADALMSHGIEAAQAADLSTIIVSSLEGGIVLTRAYRDAEPLETVAQFMRGIIAQTASEHAS